MSYISKVLRRSGAPGLLPMPLAQPKGVSNLSGVENEEEDLGQRLHRQEEEEEELQTLHRQEEEEEDLQTLRRQEEKKEELQTLHRQEEEEEDLQTLRRQEEEEEEDLQTLHRQEEEELQTLYRVTPPDATGLDAQNSPSPDEFYNEPQIPAMRALRTSASLATPAADGTSLERPAVDAPPTTDRGEMLTGPGADTLPLGSPLEAPAQHASAWASTPSPGSERPRITIDQIDVVVQEQGAPAPATPTVDILRSMKANYLREL